MRRGTLYGPYARQVTGWKLKFWFVLVTHNGDHRRYALEFNRFSRNPDMRLRDPRISPFTAHAMPADLSGLPSIPYPRRKVDNLGDAATTMLGEQDVADVTRLHLIGTLPLREEANGGDKLEMDGPLFSAR